MPNAKDLTGMKFGELTAVSRRGTSKTGCAIWECACSCGNTVNISSNSLRNGRQTCNRHLHSIKDITGVIFGRLTVVKFHGIEKHKAIWECRCQCGREINVRENALKSGNTTSCGCYKNENLKSINKTHGLSSTKEYKATIRARRRERERKLDCEWTVDMEMALRKIQPSCVLCGGLDRLATDHVQPLSSGYGLKPGNAVRLCVHCNTSKNDKTITELDDKTKNTILLSAQNFKRYWEMISEHQV